jgi:hypothetical protein
MFKSLANILSKKQEAAAPSPYSSTPQPPAPKPAADGPEVQDEHAPIYQSLAMTDEMKDALFPTTPRMISTIFERPVTALAPTPDPGSPDEIQQQLEQLQKQIQQIQKDKGGTGLYPII